MTILDIQNITVRFGGLTAVNKVACTVASKNICSIIGPNGAGKTTVFNAITGLYDPCEGTITLHGKALERSVNARLVIFWLLMAVATGILFLLAYSMEEYWEASIVANYVYREPFPWLKALSDLLRGIVSKPLRDTAFPALIGSALLLGGAWSMWVRTKRSPEAVSESRISRTFQNIRLFPQMSVLDNVLVGMDNRLRSGILDSILRLPSFRRERLWAEKEAREALHFVGLEHKASLTASSLPYGEQRRLEIARALAGNPELLLLDEPAAGMNPTESEALMKLIRTIQERGITVLLIEHHMNVVMGISEKIIVLDYGNKIAEGTPAEIRSNPKVIEAYLGKDSTHE